MHTKEPVTLEEITKAECDGNINSFREPVDWSSLCPVSNIDHPLKLVACIDQPLKKTMWPHFPHQSALQTRWHWLISGYLSCDLCASKTPFLPLRDGCCSLQATLGLWKSATFFTALKFKLLLSSLTHRKTEKAESPTVICTAVDYFYPSSVRVLNLVPIFK